MQQLSCLERKIPYSDIFIGIKYFLNTEVFMKKSDMMKGKLGKNQHFLCLMIYGIQ